MKFVIMFLYAAFVLGLPALGVYLLFKKKL